MDRCKYEALIGTSDRIYMWTTAKQFQAGGFGGIQGAHQRCIEDVVNQEWLHQKADMFSHRAALSSGSNGCDARTIIPAEDTRGVYTNSDSLVSSRYADFFVSSLSIANSVGNNYWIGFSGSRPDSDDCRGWTNSSSGLNGTSAIGGKSSRFAGQSIFCSSRQHLLCVSF